MKITEGTIYNIELSADETEMLRKVCGSVSHNQIVTAVQKVYNVDINTSSKIAYFVSNLFYNINEETIP